MNYYDGGTFFSKKKKKGFALIILTHFCPQLIIKIKVTAEGIYENLEIMKKIINIDYYIVF